LSWFKKPKTDASGSVTNVRTVGKFKGIVRVENHDEKESHNAVKRSRMVVIKDSINKLHEKMFGSELIIEDDQITTKEGQTKLQKTIEKMDCKDLGIVDYLASADMEAKLGDLLMKKTKCMVRVYILSAFDLSSRDNGSHSDPYIIMKTGNKEFNER
jgi:hypothetical protein